MGKPSHKPTVFGKVAFSGGLRWAFNRTTACSHGFWLKIRADGSLEGQDGTDGSRARCKLLQLIVIKPDDYQAKFRCNTEGEISSTVYRLSLDRDRLVMTILD
jgi:hypothetical protein